MQQTSNINFDGLRVLAMFLIVIQHYILCGLKTSEVYHYMPMESFGDILNFKRYWFITIYLGLITIAPFLSLIATVLFNKVRTK